MTRLLLAALLAVSGSAFANPHLLKDTKKHIYRSADFLDSAKHYFDKGDKYRPNGKLHTAAAILNVSISRFKYVHGHKNPEVAEKLEGIKHVVNDRNAPVMKRIRQGYNGVVLALSAVHDLTSDKRANALEMVQMAVRLNEKKFFAQVTRSLRIVLRSTRGIVVSSSVKEIVQVTTQKLTDEFLSRQEKYAFAKDCLQLLAQEIKGHSSGGGNRGQFVYHNMLSNIMDASNTAKRFDGKPSVQIFKGQKLKNKSVRLVSASGLSISRVHHGQVKSSQACPQGWHIYFKRANGELIQRSAVPHRLQDYQQRVRVPHGAVSAWIGYHEAGRSYFDNEGFRTPRGQSTGGCSFKFNLR